MAPESPPAADLPPVSALFLVDFDVKAGYTIAWKRAVAGLAVDGLVEYKSLPSGLHTVPEDLIYFVHDGHAGLSAFVNEPREEEELRHARMIAVGVLVPLSYGRLGRSWRHAQALRDMASTLVKNRNATDVLDAYWEANRVPEGFRPVAERPGRSCARSQSVVSDAALFNPDHRLSPDHPAWSLTSLLDRFGPLIFPIHRAALLRQRILISCHAPVHQVCDFVYDLSVLSNLPLSVTDVLPAPAPPHRLRPLFNIGVHDIPFLLDDLAASKRARTAAAAAADDDDDAGTGWIACTTDSILAVKDTLWDMLVTMPAAADPAWPSVECPRGTPVRATQRDLRRFHALRAGLASISTSTSLPPPAPAPAPCASDKLVEPLTWTALAYSGFMWWASAGEQPRSSELDEAAHDAALLIDPSTPSPSDPAPLSNNSPGHSAAEARVELAVIAYFHRLTAQMLLVLAGLDDDAVPPPGAYADDERLLPNDFEDPAANPVVVDSRALEAMGLDVWSASDAEFVRRLAEKYFARQASVDGKGIEICGVRIC